ncbi:Xaa-Pro aminopeptidase [Chitinibacteraceae bacterium HSL-7]
MIPVSAYATRRVRLAQQLSDGIIVVPTAPELIRNGDAHFPYRFDSDFFYLTGFTEPEAVLVVLCGTAPRTILFCRDKDIEREIWDGYRFGPEAARETFAFDEAYPIAELDARLPELLADQHMIHTPFGINPAWDERIAGWLNAVRSRVRAGINAPEGVRDIRHAIAEMRLFKDEHEAAVMREAGRINGNAHARTMRYCRPGQFEYELEAELLHEYTRHGSRFPAYSSIVAAGANACVLHYIENNARIHDGDLVLIDAGCELMGYASDITRTFPANGRFSGEQRAVYDIVLGAHSAAMALARPGVAFNDLHDAATRVLVEGLIDLGLLQGSVDGALESGSYRQFYMHRTGHWLGLDVHDVGAYRLAGNSRPLEAGMVFTVEPGLYIRPADNVPEHFAHIGIRIEDDVLVTANGHEVLTEDCPRDADAIEALMRG